MKKIFSRVLSGAVLVCSLVLAGCSSPQENKNPYDSSLISDYDWQASGDGSLITCNTDGTFQYYRSADDLTNNYFEGTYTFFIGEEAVQHITTELSSYAVTETELETVFESNEEYNESNFVCLVLNNEKCFMDGINQIETPYQTPYFGFCLEEDGNLYLDIANMNTGNYTLYIAK